ncbi:unnamed protein product [Sphenostylis stenocarpa]|uniref:DUF4378 domain-containing protein n=1 Tax=Sphenostylis stenocarpa TaxID=92480 RepID=A0AA86VML7_9FABA|nr:unnamed protein product [Sphenostylis stenocarpa]
MTPYSSVVTKDSVSRKIKEVVLKEISRKRNRHHRSSTISMAPINTNKNLLTTFVQDPVSPLIYHHHKQQVYGSKMKLTRSLSFPPPDSLSKREGSEAIDNGFQPKGKGKLCFDNKTAKAGQVESSKKFYLRSLSSGAKFFNVNEAMIARDVTCSSGSVQDQNHNEIKQFKNLKQKIEHVTGDSKKEKLRVTMDAMVHKLPQGHAISIDLKKEFFKKLSDSIITRKGEHYPGRCSDHSTSLAKPHRNNLTRKLSLQEPLESYFHFNKNDFNAESSHLQSNQLKIRTENEHSPLRMPIPLQRMLSLPDLQSLSCAYQDWEFPEISSVTEPKPKGASRDGTVSSENISYQKKSLDLNLHSSSQLQLDTTVENLIQKYLVSVDENDLVISNIVEQGSDCSSEINGKAGMSTDDFGYICLKNDGTFNDQDIEPTKSKTAVEESDSKLITEAGNNLDNMTEVKKAIMDNSLEVKETIENAQIVEIKSKQLNYDIPLFHINIRDKAEFKYVKYVLEISGLTGKECLLAWYSSDHPVDPLLYEEMESDLDFCSYGGSGQCNHHVLFDLINEALLEISGRSYCYCSTPLSSSHSHPMPKGCHTLHQVWTHMNKSLCLRSKAGLTIDDHVSRDLERRDGWVSPQLYAQCVSLELEDLILQDLLEEIAFDLACI